MMKLFAQVSVRPCGRTDPRGATGGRRASCRPSGRDSSRASRNVSSRGCGGYGGSNPWMRPHCGGDRRRDPPGRDAMMRCQATRKKCRRTARWLVSCVTGIRLKLCEEHKRWALAEVPETWARRLRTLDTSQNYPRCSCACHETDMVCEAHPNTPWPHGRCPGPGMLLR